MIDTDDLVETQTSPSKSSRRRKVFFQHKRKKKIDKQRVDRSVEKFIPYKRIISDNCIQMKKNVTNIFRIEDASARNGNDKQRNEAIYDFYTFLRTIQKDVKFIFSSFPLDMSENKDYAVRRFKMKKNTPEVRNMQQFTLKQLDFLDNNKQIDTIYLQIFGSDGEELRSIEQEIFASSTTNFNIVKLTIEQKVKLLFKLYNPLSPFPSGIPYTGNDSVGRPEWAQKIVDKRGYDPIFISQIQPLGGIKPYSTTELRTGEGFLRVLNLTVYRPKNNPNFWGERVFSFKEGITTLDIHSIDTSNPLVEQSLNRSLGEYEEQVESAKDKISRKKALNEYERLDRTVESIIEATEVLKEIHVRYILTAPTLQALNEKEKNLQILLKKSQFQAVCLLDEQERQYKAALLSFHEGRKEINRGGKQIKGSSLASSYPFHFSNHIDSDAPYSGIPLYGSGIICLSTTHKDQQRKSYNTLIIGSQGFGKTTVAKKIMKQFVEYNNNHFGFYMSDETKRLTEALGGIHLDGRSAVLNPCQIYASDVDPETKKTEEYKSFKTNLTKMRLVFGLGANVKFDSPIMTTAKKMFKGAYEEFMEKHHLDMEKITQYRPEQYPVYSDVLAYAKRKFEQETETYAKKELYDFVTALDSFISDEGDLFNRTSQFDFYDEQLVTFDMSGLIKSDPAVYNAQYYNLYTAAFSEAVRVGQREKYLFDRKKKRVDELIYTNITSDEFHNPIRTENLVLLKELDRYSREGRKLLIGQTYILHDIADAFPDYKDGTMGEISKVVMNLFKLSTYRFMLQQDESSEELLKKIFGKQLSKYDLQEIFNFDEREILLNIKGYKNIKFVYELSQQEKSIFDGGL